MKSCPTCQRTYTDDSLTYCLIDGAVLSAAYEPQGNDPPSSPRAPDPPPTEILYDPSKRTDSDSAAALYQTMEAPVPPISIPSPEPHPAQEKQGKVGWVIIGGAIFLGIVIGLVIALGLSRWSTKDGRTAEQASNSANSNGNVAPAAEPVAADNSSPTPNRNASPANTSASPAATPAATAATPNPTPRRTPAPESSPAPPKNIDVKGTWAGKDRGISYTLVINWQEGDSISGSMGDKTTRAALTGTVNNRTRRVSMRDTKVIKGRSSIWSLGTYSGSVSADGKIMNLIISDASGSRKATFRKL